MRVMITGFSGAGKSTLAARLGERYGCPVLHLDSVHFLPGWAERGDAEARDMVSAFLNKNASWVVEGNYRSLCFEQRSELADSIIILALPRLTCLFNAFRRYLRYRGQTRPDMAEGCNEKMDLEFITWILYGGRTRTRREMYDSLIRDYPGKVTVLKSKAAYRSCLEGLSCTPFERSEYS